MRSIELIFADIRKLQSVAPSEEVNTLFTELVEFALQEHHQHTLNEAQLKELQEICAVAEYQLEAYRNTLITRHENPQQKLLEFPYYENYVKLTRMERSGLQGCCTHKHDSIVFIGSGPLPLTGIVLAQNYQKKIHLLDTDEQAIEDAKKLISKLGLEEYISLEHGKGETRTHYGRYDVIYVAGLAGASPQAKKEIMGRISSTMKPHAHILARSAYGNRMLLYQKLDKNMFEGLTPLVQIDPLNDVVNSVVIFTGTSEIGHDTAPEQSK